MAGTWSQGIDTIACKPTNCPLGQFSSKKGANSESDGCTECTVGLWSAGKNATQCQAQTCSEGFKSSKIGAFTTVDGCIGCPFMHKSNIGSSECTLNTSLITIVGAVVIFFISVIIIGVY